MKEDVPQKQDGTVQVHNVRFYRIEPQEIACMAYNKTQKYLALIR